MTPDIRNPILAPSGQHSADAGVGAAELIVVGASQAPHLVSGGQGKRSIRPPPTPIVEAQRGKSKRKFGFLPNCATIILVGDTENAGITGGDRGLQSLPVG